MPGAVAVPGTLTINGNLTLATTSNYVVFVNPTAVAQANVGGTASLSGTTFLNVAAGNYRPGTYSILHASGGFGGSTITAFNTIGTFSASVRNPHFTTDINDVFLVLDAGIITIPGGSGGNQASVAGGFNNAVNNGAIPSASFNTLLGLTGVQLTNALTQVSGLAAAGAQQASTQGVNDFMSQMFNPYSRNRSDGFGPTNIGPAVAYASDDQDTDGDLAFAKKKNMRGRPTQPLRSIAALTPEPRWSFWSSVYGGQAIIDGNATTGSVTTTTRAAGFAAGLDYRTDSNTTVGFALSGGGGNWGLANGLGGGNSDVFQIGAFASKRSAEFYVSGGLSYGAHWISTNRVVTVAGSDKLEADFFASTVSGRLEGGYRIERSDFSVTPYAALQETTFSTPAYAERETSGSNAFALAYADRTTNTTRSEIGSWADKEIRLGPGNVIWLRTKLAWAHDFNNDQTVNAAFQTLPGSNFTVGGAVPVADSALVSLGAEYFMTNGWRASARFDGEFSSNKTSYAGIGALRRVW